MINDIILWIAAIERGYAAPAAWQRWAEHRIVELPFAPPWLATLLDAEQPEVAADAFNIGLGEYRGEWGEANEFHLRLGFLWLHYERGKISLVETLVAAGTYADCANSSNPCCEEFYMLASEIDGGGPVSPGPHEYPPEERTAQLFAPFVAITLNACASAGLPIDDSSNNSMLRK